MVVMMAFFVIIAGLSTNQLSLVLSSSLFFMVNHIILTTIFFCSFELHHDILLHVDQPDLDFTFIFREDSFAKNCITFSKMRKTYTSHLAAYKGRELAAQAKGWHHPSSASILLETPLPQIASLMPLQVIVFL